MLGVSSAALGMIFRRPVMFFELEKHALLGRWVPKKRLGVIIGHYQEVLVLRRFFGIHLLGLDLLTLRTVRTVRLH